MQSVMPRLILAQHGFESPQSQQTLFPGIFCKISQTLQHNNISSATWLNLDFKKIYKSLKIPRFEPFSIS